MVGVITSRSDVSRNGLRPQNTTRAWKYAVVGGLASIPLTVGAFWLAGGGGRFPLLVVFFGGLVAGLFDRDVSARAGIGAGVIGGLPGLGWILPAMRSTASDFATAWSLPPVEPVLLALFGVIVLVIAGVIGLIGGVAGGWLRTLIAG